MDGWNDTRQVVDVGYKSLSRIAEFEGPVGRKKVSFRNIDGIY